MVMMDFSPTPQGAGGAAPTGGPPSASGGLRFSHHPLPFPPACGGALTLRLRGAAPLHCPRGWSPRGAPFLTGVHQHPLPQPGQWAQERPAQEGPGAVGEWGLPGMMGGGNLGTPHPNDSLSTPQKLVHNVHNHITNQRRFNGSESIKSSWNIGVVKFLLEKLRHELVTSQHNYTDKELKGACVAYFLTKRREYRNSLNPFKGLKEKEEKKLRSRRYRLFANRAGVARLLGPEEQRLWRGVTEELMSDEEDSPSEPGVWVARSPRFRAGPLTQLCYRLDINAKHGAKANRVYGPPSERLPSAEAQLLPPHLYDPHFQEREEVGDSSSAPFPLPHKAFCPDLRPFLEIKVEKDE
uniref:Chromosome 14 open reading frame 93 n=1 Tax=Chelonoidis abingdonii TaxID=106734 RepID=A0A8C0H0D8_CHEAB